MRNFSPLAITYRAISDLAVAKRNPRTHSSTQIEQIARSIAAFGWTNPVLIDEDQRIIAGHGRLEAARKLGIAEVPTITLAGLDDAQKRALVIADNQLALNAGWDSELLALELGELGAAGFDVSLIGFSDDEMAAILADRTEGLTDPDDVPEAPAEPVSVLGDVWTLGRHRVMAGDSTNPQHVAILTEGKLVDLCFTSPPYLHQRDYKTMTEGWDALMRGVFGILPVKDDAQVLVNLGMVHRDGEWLPYWDEWIGWMREQGWRRFGWYVWDQGFGLPGDWNGRLAPSHEWLFHFNRQAERARKSVPKHPNNIVTEHRKPHHILRDKGDGKHVINSPRSMANTHKIPDSVIRIMRHQGAISGVKGDHPALFPVDLVSEMLTAFSDPDDTVYEPFCGSGTQLISAQKNGRSCLGMEIAPVYVDIAVMRWQAFTGQQATHASTGRSFAETADERARVAA